VKTQHRVVTYPHQRAYRGRFFRSNEKGEPLVPVGNQPFNPSTDRSQVCKRLAMKDN
jgi:hypothetical protein